MDEYIKKSDVLEYLSLRRNQVLKSPLSTLDAKFEVMEIFDFVGRVEVADVAQVRHGRWVKMDTTGLLAVEPVWNCSSCGYPAGVSVAGSKYCPNCGAKMDGGTQNEQS